MIRQRTDPRNVSIKYSTGHFLWVLQKHAQHISYAQHASDKAHYFESCKKWIQVNEVHNRDKKKEVMYHISYTSEENDSKTNGSVKAKISLFIILDVSIC